MTPAQPPENPKAGKDDLDAFFDAAASKNPRAIHRAAEKVRNAASAPTQDRAFVSDPPPIDTGEYVVDLNNMSEPDPDSLEAEDQILLDNISKQIVNDQASNYLAGKFIAVDSRIPGGYQGDPNAPFVLIPAGVHHYLPWYAWLVAVLGVLLIISGIIFLPSFHLNRLTARLGDSNGAVVQHTMRQLIINADNRTVSKLYDLASSSQAGLTTRLRAVDTMTLIRQSPDVDRALLRLELAGDTDEKVREAAIAARKQRAASRTRTAP